MGSRVAFIILGAVALAGAPGPAAAQDPYAHTVAVARREAAAALESAGAFGVTTAVMVDGRIIHAEASGRSGSDGTARPDPATQFNAGSISKVFAAVAMLRLRDQGRVHLDQPVASYLPSFRMNDPRYRRITIRMLLDHTSGMPGTNYRALFDVQENPAYVAQSLALLRDSAFKSDPGDANVYCNDCFTVAQAVIESVSGMRFADFVQREIFTPARMSDSSYGFKAGNRNIAAVFARDAPDRTLPPERVNALGTGGLTTTAVDLCRFSQALFAGELLSPRSLRELQKRQPGRLGAGFSLAYAGLGWDSVAEPDFAERGLTVLGKDGFTVFFRSQIYVAPKQDVTVVTLMAGPADLPGHVVIDMSKRILWAALEDKGAIAVPPPARPPVPPVAPIPEQFFQYAGYYGGAGHSIMRLAFDAAANVVTVARLVDGTFVAGAPFTYGTDQRFHAANGGSYSFARTKDGRKLLLQHVDDAGGVTTLAEGISPDFRADTSLWKSRTWVPRNLQATDFVTPLFNGIFKTGTIAELPGIVYLHAGNPGDATPYGLSDRTRARMILTFEADLVDLRLVHEDGRTRLLVGGFEFVDAESVPPLQASEQFVIGPDGDNVARNVIAGTSLSGAVPAQARLLVYAPDGSIAFDSLFGSAATVAVTPGSVVVFSGPPASVYVSRAP